MGEQGPLMSAVVLQCHDVRPPLAEPSPLSTSQTLSSRPQTPLSPSNPLRRSAEAAMASIDHPAKDFKFLLKPENFHPITQTEVPQAFRTSPLQPAPETPLADLLAKGHFRAGAISSAHQLVTSTSSTDHAQIFSLLYARLSSLVLIDATNIAAQEINILEDLNSTFYRDDITQTHLVPWELRLLAVRLQGIGLGDRRRGVMGYYDLARDARTQAFKVEGEQRKVWEERLMDLGLRVGNALVEMGDLDSAARHLESLRVGVTKEEDEKMKARLALLYLRIGDVAAARRCLAEENENATEVMPATSGVLKALCSMAEGRYEHAVTEWQSLREGSQEKNEEMIVQNLAVCLLYAGRMSEARTLLESLVDQGNSFHGLTFNLSTIYELCTEKSRTLKLELAEKIAAQSENEAGWEKQNADFKL
ncbi:MAG: hypothetical protein M1812_006518 [Candelaria pacifica]|nr:MAG: hypothetical protein M1812_006518 [Candelaria pacifica]